jgi:Na+-transporting NADH:ubiquinone oxidoreductase subunit NqrC
MKNSSAYAVVFTLVLCAACSAMLTFATVHWEEEIRANEEYALTYAIVDALGLCGENSTREAVVKAFSQEIKVQDKKAADDPDIYIGKNKELGCAIQWTAQGKYGPIKGVLALTPDKQRIQALRVYEQQETPGLGGEVANPKWLAKFSGLPISADGQTGIIISSKVKGANVVDSISGASKTTFAVGTCLNEAIATLCSGGQKLAAVDFGLGPDAVTRATPGYPKELKKPANFEEQKKRPPFMAPPGVTNIALKKPVTCSMEEDDFIEGFADQITDGIKKSREGDYVDLGPGLQWAQVDLGAEHTVYCVVVWHFYRNPIIYRDIVIQVSNDPEFESGVTTLFNNDDDDSSGLGKGNDPSHMAAWWGEVGDARGPSNSGTQCRYVRVYTNGGCADELNRFVEIAVYGK